MIKNPEIKILWLAPNFNHYKARFLNHLAQLPDIKLAVISGTGRKANGDVELNGIWDFVNHRLDVPKRSFGNSKLVRAHLKHCFNDYNWVLIPAEKKNLILILYALMLRVSHKSTKLISYNHEILKSGNGRVTRVDKIMTKFYYRCFDRIIFYTKTSHDSAVQKKLIVSEKAFWANNTIDTIEVAKNYNFSLPKSDTKTIVFIGRLIASKRLDLLISYFERLQDIVQEDHIHLEVIGDGPKRDIIKHKSNITWHGAITDEAKIAPIMKRASLVFIPGHSGLSVNHAFAYGRPYITLKGPSHAPEITYIEQGVNGYILDGTEEANVNMLARLLSDVDKIHNLCMNAQQSGKKLSVINWAEKMKLNFFHE